MKWKNPHDNFGRRTGGDRRKKSVPEIEKERRSGEERRKNPDRRTNVERRQSEDSNEVQVDVYKKRNPVNRRDIIFGKDE